MHYYHGKRVLITGGSSGIGLATAKELVRAGASVAIAARGEARLDQALAELRALRPEGSQAIVERFVLDVGDPEAIGTVAPQILETLGGLDVLVSNAGVTHPAAFLDTPPEIFDRMMRVNYFGTVNLTRALLPTLLARKSGHVVIVSSLAGVFGIYGYTAYAASKFALAGFGDCLRQELVDTGVSLSLVFPPDTDTPQLEEENRIKPPETKAVAGNVKVMSPDEVARVMLAGVAARRYHIVPGFMGKVTAVATRWAPGLTRYVADSSLRGYRKKSGGAP